MHSFKLKIEENTLQPITSLCMITWSWFEFLLKLFFLDEILMDNNVTHEEDYSFVIDSTKEHKDGQQETMMLESMAKIENPTNS